MNETENNIDETENNVNETVKNVDETENNVNETAESKRKKEKILIIIVVSLMLALVCAALVMIISTFISYRQHQQEIKDIWEHAETGDTVLFGTYEQDNHPLNGKEDIEWIVLDKKDGKMLLLSKYILDYQPYNYDSSGHIDFYYHIQWSNCSLRTWLNKNFIRGAFSRKERKKILTTDVAAETSPDYPDVDAGEDTQDQVFLLSYSEVNEYLPELEDRKCQVTETVWQQDEAGGGHRDHCSRWWLRNLGMSNSYTMYIADDGYIYTMGYSNKGFQPVGLRPALWVNIDDEG